jgi:hypothetical protein
MVCSIGRTAYGIRHKAKFDLFAFAVGDMVL